jgi:hypothetical protein
LYVDKPRTGGSSLFNLSASRAGHDKFVRSRYELLRDFDSALSHHSSGPVKPIVADSPGDCGAGTLSHEWVGLKTNLAQLLRGRAEGIFVAPFEQGEIGPELFEAACRMGLEGLVSKHRERVYRGGRSPDWLKVKNRKHPAFSRVADQL